MRNILYIFLFAFLALVSVSCQDEIMQNKGYEPAEVGTEVLFGSRAGFESGNSDSRTVYGTVYDGSVGGQTVKFQHIDWIPEDDHVLIYSPQAANPYGEDELTRHNVTYQVAETDAVSTTVSDFAYLQKEESQVGALHWSSTEAHDFYAIYPSPDMLQTEYQGNPGSITSAEGVRFVKNGEKVFVEALLSADQTPGSANIKKDSNGNWTIAPDMRNAFMVAKETATTADGGVDLTFYPMVTAVEITLTFPEDSDGDTEEKQISDIWIAGDGVNPIIGRFSSVDLKEDWDGSSYVTCNANADASARVHFSLRETDEGGVLKVKEGCSITFTAFLLPGTYGNVLAENLKVSFSEAGVGEMSKTLADADIKANVKTRINGLTLPSGAFNMDASKWMSQIPSPEKAKISALSIPGAGGAFTRTASADYVQQTLDLEGLWKYGVRAFEFACKRSFNSGEENSLYDQPVRVGSSSGNGYTNAKDANNKDITVGSVMTELLDKVISTQTETAAVIISYQSEGNDNDGSYSNNRCSEAFAKELAQMYTDFQTLSEGKYAGRLIQYTPDLTLAQARGKLIVIARLNQQGEEEPSYDNRDKYYSSVEQSVTQARTNYENSVEIIAEVSDADGDPLTGITLIDGCGTGKDRWGRRGYKVNGKPVNDFGDNVTETGNTEFMEKYMTSAFLSFALSGNVYTATSGSNTITRGEPDFAFDTNNAEGKQCWYQDWARVVKSQVRYRQWEFLPYSNRFFWFESFNEKVEHVCATYDKSIADTDRTYTYINSLSGYYPAEGSSSSVTPLYPGEGWWGGASAGGNIAGLATELNKAFYDHVVAKIQAGETGPTGIVLIDRITATSGDPAYDLLGLILSNNNEFYEE